MRNARMRKSFARGAARRRTWHLRLRLRPSSLPAGVALRAAAR